MLVEFPADGDAVIHEVLPRTSRFSRRAAGSRPEEQVVAANVDVVWIVSALDGELSPRRLDVRARAEESRRTRAIHRAQRKHPRYH